jgi:anti-sigma B factor antagonist
MTTDPSTDTLALQVAEHSPDTRVITVVGEVDALTAPQLANSLNGQLATARIVVIDLDGVQFIGSAGLAVLLKANELATQAQAQLRLVCNSRIVNRALDVTGLRECFTFSGTVADALRTP